MEAVPIAIDVKNLTKRYSHKKGAPDAVKNISLQVTLGHIVCLLGPNGSGKTTLLKSVAGLLEPTEGSVSVMGYDMRTQPLAARSHIGWMPAEDRSGFYGRLSGRQNLEFFATLQNIPTSEMQRLIGNLAIQLDLHDDLDQRMLRVSGGGRQKIGLMRALLHNPSVLVLDEPFRNLDPHTVLRLRRLLKDHITRIHKKTVLLSTHLLEEARRLADVLIILNKGEIVKTIDSRELNKELQHATVEELYLKTIAWEEKSDS
ncbi:MAG: ABC transporter ATP-binding protein [Elusimicrobia bacterium]|nr:ABC transporter ATP-binding protein [Candidatus Obscuribacterium magneticum]